MAGIEAIPPLSGAKSLNAHLDILGATINIAVSESDGPGGPSRHFTQIARL
jgi:hypothetical protein